MTHSLMITVVLVAVPRQPPGAAEQPGREAGIVLRRQDDSRTEYEGEESLEEANEQADAADDDRREAVANALPDPSEADLARRLPSAPAPVAKSVLGVGPRPAGGATGGGASGARQIGGAATASVFGVEGTGHKFVYAFDRSVSMTGAPLAAAKGQLLASLESLDPVHQFQILFFNHRLTTFDLTQGRHRVAFANDKTREAARQFVDGISADGGTDRFQALRRALAMEPDVVFFLTDADDAMTGSELAQVQRLNERVGATIAAIEFGRGPDSGKDNFLKQLARMTGGQYGYVDTTRLVRE